MSTSTPLPPPTQAGVRKPRRRWWRIALFVALGVVVVIAAVAAGVSVWMNSLQQCSKAANPAQTGAVTEYCIAEPYRPGSSMVIAKDGALWYFDLNRKIARFTPQTGATTEFAAPSTPNEVAYHGMVWGSDGNIWYIANNKLGRLSTSGQFTEYDLPKEMGFSAAIAAGPGRSLWVTMGRPALLKVTIPTDATQALLMTAVPLPANTNPTVMAAGPGGSLWIATGATPTITRITPAGVVTAFPLNIPGPAASCGTDCRTVTALAMGPDGNMWFTDGWGHVGKITPAGGATFFSASTLGAGTGYGAPISLNAGPDGNMWFSTEDGGVGRVTPSGAFTKFTLPHMQGGVSNISAGPDGGVWFVLGFSQPMEPSSRFVRITP